MTTTTETIGRLKYSRRIYRVVGKKEGGAVTYDEESLDAVMDHVRYLIIDGCSVSVVPHLVQGDFTS